MKLQLLLAALFFPIVVLGQPPRTDVLTLGTFHFSFPNLDVKKVETGDQIDVLEPRYQAQIADIVDRIARFRPTIIAIERRPELQGTYDSLYESYLQGKHQLTRNEEQQIGFRIAKMLHLRRLFCVDTWGRHYSDVDSVVEEKDSVTYADFLDHFYKNDPDTAKLFYGKTIFRTEGILPQLRQMNAETTVTRGLGNYLVNVFKYQTKENEYFGADFVTGWWFNRNLRIFRNIQRIRATADDRILVIFGAGHLTILNYLFRCSPEYRLVATNDYLK